MMLQIPGVLNPAQLDTVRALLSKARFVDGKLRSEEHTSELQSH